MIDYFNDGKYYESKSIYLERSGYGNSNGYGFGFEWVTGLVNEYLDYNYGYGSADGREVRYGYGSIKGDGSEAGHGYANGCGYGYVGCVHRHGSGHGSSDGHGEGYLDASLRIFENNY